MKTPKITQAELETAKLFLELFEMEYLHIYYQGTLEQVAKWLKQPYWTNHGYKITIATQLDSFNDYVLSQNMAEVQF